MASAVPQFISKLYKLANAPEHESYIAWNPEGTHFWVVNVESFSRDVLPVYFKHNNYASFVRQLNMYGFHRSTEPKGKVEPGVMLIERFSHPMFLRGREDLIGNIHRKTATVQKRIKTEDPDPNFVMPSQSFGFPQEPAGELPVVVAQMRDSILRLESANASLLAQSAQQQEVVNHLIRILARHNLLSETELPRQMPVASLTRGVRMFQTQVAPPLEHPPMDPSQPQQHAAQAAQWDVNSPDELQVYVDDDDEQFNSMLTQLDLPASFDPPILC